ncbi:hypothetical protein B0H66DRAFT_296419 [Apodospora peruviana]|uniref:Fungal N-terminal domain-containing protein n=1 Tax=Apodospora peruviana TaxID=516989 RepID=A0AAE0M2D1_9PEZI|nr:hypothetical protein B0H66DRAFT_296419 [Apodospora peruviana]
MSGLEVVGAAAAVLSLIARVYKAYTSFRDAPVEIRAFCAELDSLRQILKDIAPSLLNTHDLLRADDRALGVDSILVTIQSCEAEVNVAWRAVSQLRSEPGGDWKTAFPKFGKSVRWSLNAEEIEKSTRRLEALKQNLVLSMLHFGITVDSSILRQVSAVEDLVEGLGDTIESRMQRLRGDLVHSLRLLECQIMNHVTCLSGTAKAQHLSNEQLMLETSERFADLIDSRGFNNSLPSAETQPHPTVVSPSISPPSHHSSESSHLTPVLDNVQEKREPQKDTSLFRQTLETLLIRRPSTAKFLGAGLIQDAGDLNDILTAVMRKASSKGGNRLLLRLSSRILPNMEVFSRMSETIGATQAWNPLLPMIYAALKMAVTSIVSLELLLEAMSAIQDALMCCEREYALYPEPQLKLLMSTLYLEAVTFFESAARSLEVPAIFVYLPYNSLKHKAQTITKLSKRIRKEAEYFHRLEVREISCMVREVGRKQDQVMRAVEEQQRTLESLQEEQKVLASIMDHQQVLQALQQLLARFPPLEVGSVVTETR